MIPDIIEKYLNSNATYSSMNELIQKLNLEKEVEEICSKNAFNINLIKSILEMMMRGFNNAEVAQKLGVHRITIQRYARALRKLNDTDFNKLKMYLFESGDFSNKDETDIKNVITDSKRGIIKDGETVIVSENINDTSTHDEFRKGKSYSTIGVHFYLKGIIEGKAQARKEILDLIRVHNNCVRYHKENRKDGVYYNTCLYEIEKKLQEDNNE